MDELILPGANINFFNEVDAVFAKTGDYLDAVIDWCHRNDIDPTYITALISANNVAIARLRCDAESLHFLRTERRIPI